MIILRYSVVFILSLFFGSVTGKTINISLTSNGWVMAGNIVAIFAEPGDSLAFNWESGNHTIQSTSLPAGAAPFNFGLDSLNPVQTVVLSKEGDYHWTSSMYSGTEVVYVYSNSTNLRFFEFDDGNGSAAQFNYVLGTNNPNLLFTLDSLLSLPYGTSPIKPLALIADGRSYFNGTWDWHIPINNFLLMEFCPEAFDYPIDQIEGHEMELIDQGGVCPVSWIRREVTDALYDNIKNRTSKIESVFPNPFTDQIQINFNEPTTGQLILFNKTGSVLLRTSLDDASNFILPTTDLPKGLYFIRVENNDSNYHFKILKH